MTNRPTIDTGDGQRELRLSETQSLLQDATTRAGVGLHGGERFARQAGEKREQEDLARATERIHGDQYWVHPDYQLFRGPSDMERIRIAQMKPKKRRTRRRFGG